MNDGNHLQTAAFYSFLDYIQESRTLFVYRQGTALVPQKGTGGGRADAGILHRLAFGLVGQFEMCIRDRFLPASRHAAAAVQELPA